jgi:hypothetical protein
VGVSNLQVYELLTRVFGLDRRSGGLDGRTITDTIEAENRGMALTDAEDVILEVGASCPWRKLVGMHG